MRILGSRSPLGWKPIWRGLGASLLAVLVSPVAGRALTPVAVTVRSWAPGGTGSLVALFLQENGAEPVPPAFEFCAPPGVTFGSPTVSYPSGTTLAAAAHADCSTGLGLQGTAFVVPGATTTPASQVYKMTVPFTVATTYTGVPHYVGGPSDPHFMLLQLLGTLGSPGAKSHYSIETIVHAASGGTTAPDLSLSKSAAVEGDTVSFRIDVTNYGAAASSQFSLSDALDPHLDGCVATVVNGDKDVTVKPIGGGAFVEQAQVSAVNALTGFFTGHTVYITCHLGASGSFSNTACMTGGGDPHLPASGPVCATVSYEKSSATRDAPKGLPGKITDLALATVTSFPLGTSPLPEYGVGAVVPFTSVIVNVSGAATPATVTLMGLIGSHSASIQRAGGATFSVVHADGTVAAPKACPSVPATLDWCDTGVRLQPREAIVVQRNLKVLSAPAGGGLVLDDSTYVPGFYVPPGPTQLLAVLPGVPVPTAPVAPSGLAAKAIAGSKATLTWKDNSNNEDSFRVEMATGKHGAFIEVSSAAANATSTTVSGLKAGTQYGFRVRARNGALFSGYTKVAWVNAIR
jgi:uncharacterized repeat protein (TIGR01451 family)